jgi:hypothetical protein
MMRTTKIAVVLVFAGTAVIIAGLLANFAHNDLGLTPSVIREAALLCSGALCLGLYSGRFGRRK